jgi:transcription initiation factor IIF auxiliary subunit
MTKTTPRQIAFNQYSMWTKKKNESDWYEWCVFVDEDAQTLKTISGVQYFLHPSFPDPERVKKNGLDRFALYSAGWGNFSIQIHIMLVGGSTIKTNYQLRLQNDNWPKKSPPDTFNDTNLKSVYEALSQGQFRWRKFETIVSRTPLSKDKVSLALNELAKDNLVRKAYFRSVDNQELWGATEIVGIAPRI